MLISPHDAAHPQLPPPSSLTSQWPFTALASEQGHFLLLERRRMREKAEQRKIEGKLEE